MTALIVIACIIFVIALILSIRAHIHVQYEADELTAYASWAFLKIPLIPLPEKKEKAEKTPKKQPEEKPVQDTGTPKEPKPKGPNPLKNFYANEGIDGIIQILKKLLEITGKLGRRFINSFVIDEMILDIIVSRSDAAKTAEEYGKMCQKVFPVAGAVCANCNVKKYAVNINPDYIGKGLNKYAFVMEISLNPRKLINALLLFVFGAVFKVGIRVFKSMTKTPQVANADTTAENNIENNNVNNTESGV